MNCCDWKSDSEVCVLSCESLCLCVGSKHKIDTLIWKKISISGLFLPFDRWNCCVVCVCWSCFSTGKCGHLAFSKVTHRLGHRGTKSRPSEWDWLRTQKLLQQPSPSQTRAKTLFRARKTLCLRSRALHCSNSKRGKSTCPWFPIATVASSTSQHLAPDRWGEQNRGWFYQMDICVSWCPIYWSKLTVRETDPPSSYRWKVKEAGLKGNRLFISDTWMNGRLWSCDPMVRTKLF